MSRNLEFQIGEWYHCYTRGVEKRQTFQDAHDYDRFLSLLYLANSSLPVTIFSQHEHSLSSALALNSESSLVTLGAYCLMPNHYHLVIKEEIEGGISKFMQKLGTAYTMYFNTKNERVGNLFVKPFRAKHLADDTYFKRVIQYLHLNPAELFEPGWKEGTAQNFKVLEQKLAEYQYSSLKDYNNPKSPTRKLISGEALELYEGVSFSEILSEAAEYYRSLKL